MSARVRTFAHACKTHSGMVIHGLFVVDKTKTLTWNDGLRTLLTTPGVNIVWTEGFDTDALVTAVKSTLQFYSNQLSE